MPKIIIVELAGGLGNQLFQYAFAGALETCLKEEFKINVEIYLDATSVLRDKKRSFGLRGIHLAAAQFFYSPKVITSRSKLFSLLGVRLRTSLSDFEKVINLFRPYVDPDDAMECLVINEEPYFSAAREKRQFPVLDASEERDMFEYPEQDEENSDQEKFQQTVQEKLQEKLQEQLSAQKRYVEKRSAALVADALSILHRVASDACASNKPVFIRGYWQHAGIVDLFVRKVGMELYGNAVPSTGWKDGFAKTRSASSRVFADKIAQTPYSVSLHVRRADYLDTSTKAVFPPCSPGYYLEAIHRVFAKNRAAGFKASHMSVFVFSDDMAWCKTALIPALDEIIVNTVMQAKLDAQAVGPKKAVTVSDVSLTFHKDFTCEFIPVSSAAQGFMRLFSRDFIPDTQELELMSMCSHHVLANSSFSWWGSGMLHKIFAAPHPDAHNAHHGNAAPPAVVVAPLYWSADEEKNEELLLPSWDAIDQQSAFASYE